MTNPVAPPEVIQASPWPALGSANYNAEAYAAGTSQPAAFARQGEIAQATHTNAVSANESALAAQQYALDAGNAAAPALAAANFKGLWPGLSGPINKPACVKHNGRFWMLLANLADVTASEPGVSADWTALDSGAAISQQITSSGATVNAVAGVVYVFAVADATLVLPTPGSQLKGDKGGVRLSVSPSGLQVVDFNGNNYLGIAAGQRHIDLASFALDWTYEDNTVGYI